LFEDDPAAVPFHLPFFAPCVAGDSKAVFAKACERGETVAAWGLQPHEHADRFEDRGFALSVVAGEDGTSFGRFEIERLKAPEVHQSQRADHGVFLNAEIRVWEAGNLFGRAICFFAGNFPARSFSLWLADSGVDLFSHSKPVADAALSVTQLLRRMKLILEGEIGVLWVEGEVSNLKKQGSGHWYFSLKDEGAQIQCVMFSAARREGSAALLDGAKVRVFAEASVYEARGQLQIIVRQVERAGAGDLQAKFEQLKRRLQEEGLFDAERKKPLPFFPRVVGIVTSESGAALQDMLNVLSRRAPWVKAVLYPVRVQGKGAEVEIARAIERIGRPHDFGLPRCEVLIVGRGGGSIEDLWNFNEEIVARAIAACPLPVVSAVGHEIDFTIADFVADLRAPTPSAAAELVVPDAATLKARLAQLRRRGERVIHERISQGQRQLEILRRGTLQRDGERLLREPVMRLDALADRLMSTLESSMDSSRVRLRELGLRHRGHHPARVLERRVESLAAMRRQFDVACVNAMQLKRERLMQLAGLLRALGPESAFQRGFSITLDAQGRLVKSAHELKPGDELRTRFADGETRSRVFGD
jgi:exodeoxyribonuclease VII large subunit